LANWVEKVILICGSGCDRIRVLGYCDSRRLRNAGDLEGKPMYVYKLCHPDGAELTLWP